MSQKFRHSVRFKLMLAALTLLVIPWAGYRYLEETEIFLRDAQDQNLANTARALALLVQSRIELIPTLTAATPEYPNPNLYVHPLQNAPAMDGFSSEWEPLNNQFQTHLGGNGEKLQIAVGEHGNYLYLKLRVTDKQLHYKRYIQQSLERIDSVQLSFKTANNILKDFLFVPEAPGSLIAHTVHKRRNELVLGPTDNRIKGNWQDIEHGYTLEMRIPKQLLGSRLGLKVNDYHAEKITTIATSALDKPAWLGTLVYPVPELSNLLKQASQPIERRRVIATQGYVIAKDGSLDVIYNAEDNKIWLINKLTSLALRHQTSDSYSFDNTIDPYTMSTDRILVKPVSSALLGKPAMIRYRPAGKDNLILAASHPIYAYNQPVGAVLVEQTTEALLSIQNHALQRLLSITLILFLFVALVLLGFASLLTARIRNLHKRVDEAVTDDGRIVGSIVPSKSKDEIGELSREFANVLGRLSDYNHYLEAMASRLTHELRTPLSIVRTSLDSCRLTSEDDTLRPYLERAQQGADRLETIIKRLHEATRLEKILADVELESIDMQDLAQSMMTSFKAIHPNIHFAFNNSAINTNIDCAPDLICQAMEKIIANAIDFHQHNSTIHINLSGDIHQLKICIENTGSKLPDNIDPFQSMVSVRNNAGSEPHLGLGLYLVRLIAEFHGGTATAQHTTSNNVVSVCISLPIKA